MRMECAKCIRKDECYVAGRVSFMRLMFQMGVNAECPDFKEVVI